MASLHSPMPFDGGLSTGKLLSVRDVVVSFRNLAGGWNEVVQGVSFDAVEGETVALVGESGSGKSVTSLSIMGLHDPQHVRETGSIKVAGREVLGMSEREKRRMRGDDISMIFQEPMTSLNPILSIGRQLTEVMTAHRNIIRHDARREALSLLDKVGIASAASRLDDYPHNLSGGMRQRVMIAMALACNPRVLIADEPTTALDVTIQSQILALIRDLQVENKMTVLFITHDMGVVAEIADRMLVMRNGEVLESGDVADVFRAPRTHYARMLLDAVPKLGSMTGQGGPRPFVIAGSDEKAAPSAPEPSGPAILDVRNLTVRFGTARNFLGRPRGYVHAVENVSFSLKRGETLSLVGESGCGKSSTGRSLMQLVKPDGGLVRLDGSELTGLSAKGMRDARRDIQMIFQDPFASLNPRIRVGDAIAEPMTISRMLPPKDIRARVASLLHEVGLPADAIDRYPHEFSGGQRQRICIARALSSEPKVIVADEAVSALDVSVKASVVNLMMKLQASRGISYLFISHDMAVVERISHRVAVMWLGEIVEIGDREAVFSTPKHPYTQRLLSAIPVPDPQLRGTRPPVPQLEITTPLRPAGHLPKERRYHEVAPGHLVMDWSDDTIWSAVA